jgi:hypothetical protein
MNIRKSVCSTWREGLPLFVAVSLVPGCFGPSDDADDTFDPTSASLGESSVGDATADDAPTTDPSATDPDDGASTETDTSPDESSDGADASTDAETSEGVDTTDEGSSGTTGEESTDEGPTDESTTDTGVVETRVVFATAQSYLPVALPGAAAACQSAADDAGLDGTFLGWVSYAGFEPAADFVQFDGQYVLTDGTVVADGWDDLVDGSLDHAINLDETGAIVVGIEVLTNTDPDGTATVGGASVDNCTAFMSMSVMQSMAIGRTTASSDEWTQYSEQVCALPGHFFCFEQ